VASEGTLEIMDKLRNVPWWAYFIVLGLLLIGTLALIRELQGEMPQLPMTYSRLAPQREIEATASAAHKGVTVQSTEAAQATTIAQHIKDTGWEFTIFGTATPDDVSAPTRQPTPTLEPLGASRPELLIDIPLVLGKSRAELETRLGAPLSVIPAATPTLRFPRFAGAALSYELKPYDVTVFLDGDDIARGVEARVPTLEDRENYDLSLLNHFLARFGVSMPQAPPDYEGPSGKTWYRTQENLYVDVVHTRDGGLFFISVWQADVGR
jgi:hypothetical protein